MTHLPRACRRAQAGLERAFVDGRWALRPATRAHIFRCEQCRRAYERMFAAEAALGAGAAPSMLAARLSPSEKAMLLDMVLPAPVGAPSASGWPRLSLLRADLLAAFALAVLVLGLALRGGPPAVAPGAGLAARGAAASTMTDGPTAPSADPALSSLGLRALCLQREPAAGHDDVGAPEGELTVRSLGVRPMPGVAPCGRRQVLGFTGRNETGTAWHLQLVLVLADGRTVELTVDQGDGEGQLQPGADERPLATRYPLRDAPAGPLRIIAYFSPQPAPPGQLLRAVRDARPPARWLDAKGRAVELTIEVGP